jgi:hypothetical protein
MSGPGRDDGNVTDADTFLERYLAGLAPRLEWLRERAAQPGGPDPDALDFSRDSLVPVWTWATSQFRLRDEREGDRVDPANVPMWYGRSPAPAAYWWSDDTLHLIDALAYYFGETLRRAVPGSRWQVGHAEVRGWINEGQPVLSGFADGANPVLIVTGLAGRVYVALRPDQPNIYRVPAATPTELRDAFDSMMAFAT